MGEQVMNSRLAAVTCALLLALPFAARADERDDTLRALDQCAGVGDKDQRLACYDQVAPQVKAALAAHPIAHPGAPTVAEQKSWFGFDFGDLFGTSPKAQDTPAKFGSEALPAKAPAAGEEPPPGPIDSISAKVTEVTYNQFGKFVVFLENGQVWRQIEGDGDRAQFPKGDDVVVTIERGALGSYNLLIGDSAKTFKVKRVK
jgi:hypothetical protein